MGIRKVVPLQPQHKVVQGDDMKTLSIDQLKEAAFLKDLMAQILIRAEKEGKYQPARGETA